MNAVLSPYTTVLVKLWDTKSILLIAISVYLKQNRLGEIRDHRTCTSTLGHQIKHVPDCGLHWRSLRTHCMCSAHRACSNLDSSHWVCGAHLCAGPSTASDTGCIWQMSKPEVQGLMDLGCILNSVKVSPPWLPAVEGGLLWLYG